VAAHQLLDGPVSGSTFVSGAAAWSRANRYSAVIAGSSNDPDLAVEVFVLEPVPSADAH
jgi:hypothetical protein